MATGDATTLRYDAPARDWEREALPIGNGHLGAMLLGEAGATRLALNVASLWTGGENPSGEYDDDGFGNYQALGSLHLVLDEAPQALRYSRTLDLSRGVHRVAYDDADRSSFVEEAIASHPHGVIVLAWSASAPGGRSGRLRLEGAHGETTVVGQSGLAFAGTLKNGLIYRAELVVVSADGAVSAAGNELRFQGCRSLVCCFTAETDYVLDEARGFRGEAPDASVRDRLRVARELGWEKLLSHHVADHARLFERVELDLGASSSEIRALPHGERVARYEPGRDPELVATLFHYGRYLLAASSRPGGLPANLQGLWNDSNNPPWHADYHTNINVQMCYWAAEPCALGECHWPLFELLERMRPACRRATRAAFGDVPGFAYRTSHNPFGGQGWAWNLPANAWYALHFFEHFAFTGDRAFLAERALPFLREVSEFWLARLVERADGALLAPGGWSPEHGPVEDGVTYDQALIAELFRATLAAALELECDDELVRRVTDAQARLLGPAIGRFGQLQEWAIDRDDPDDRHRHTSHLIGVFPGVSLSRERTPALAQAAEVSLRARGDTGDSWRSWTWPWRALLWARLGSAADASRMLDGYVAHNLLPNLLATHPPLQLDGSLAFPACIAELLLQSHAGVLVLLPALDRARWPRGSFRGLRARGGFEIGARWDEAGLVEAELRSVAGRPAVLRSDPLPHAVEDSKGRAVALERARDTVRFETAPDERYRIRCT